MNRYKKFHRQIAVFFLLVIFPTLLPNNLFANNNGPVAPESASFEPVDATDMVNLVTGDMSYVLPILNVPSPEGGYPLSLSYHAGIAMDEEASWVGLGWNINPGAINRYVNGTPDDWTKTSVNEFFYDNGNQEDEYTFSIGGSFPNGLTVGLGASWGSNRAFGGSVALGYDGLSGSISTNHGFGVGFNGITFNSSGVGFSVGSRGTIGYGLNLEMSYDVIGGNLSASTAIGRTNFSSVGMSFKTGSISTGPLTASSSSQSSSTGSFDVKIAREFTGINLGVFYFGFGHASITYSMFKSTDYKTSGALYPEDYKIDEIDIENHSSTAHGTLSGYYRPDVHDNRGGAFYQNGAYTAFAPDPQGSIGPNYDNYIVNSQGLSGQIAPYSLQEYFLSKEGTNFFVNTNINTTNDLGQNTNFRFANSNSSFLRINNGSFIYNGALDLASLSPVIENLNRGSFSGLSRTGNPYSISSTPSGDLIKNGNKMREGNYIEVFTNEQIKLGSINGFIEAKGINRHTDPMFSAEDKGIGAYRITTIDGKTYHYSLPVYQLESYYKNFKNQSDENDSFFESKKERQYATHWLLTAITGSDYVDTNLNGQVDKDDYGYWVEFQYGKWSDGYMWRSPHDGYKEMGDSYSYFWGRKQVYYLDIVKTRTHSALFIKKLRQDDCSNEFNEYKIKANDMNVFNRTTNCKAYVTQRNTLKIGNKGSLFYSSNGNQYTSTYDEINAQKTNFRYIVAPKNLSLALDKIMVLKNEDVINLDKGSGNLTTSKTGYLYTGYGYTNVKGKLDDFPLQIYTLPNLYSDTGIVKSFGVNLHQNILDNSDIESLNLEAKSIKSTNFIYNYSLAKQTNSSVSPEKGRLTLTQVVASGKKEIQTMPPYRFNYYDENINYSKDDIDNWGYHKTNPKLWSLKQIETPMGGKIMLDYESDSFRREAADIPDPLAINMLMNHFISCSAQYKTGLVPPSTNGSISNIVKNGDRISLSFWLTIPSDKQAIFKGADVYLSHSNGVADYDDVYSIDDFSYDYTTPYFPTVTIVLKKNSETKYHDFFNEELYPPSAVLPLNGTKLYSLFLYIPTDVYTYNKYPDNNSIKYCGPNGKMGGGIRVKKVSIIDENNSENVYEYSYNNPNSNTISGITSYEPFDDERSIPAISMLPVPDVNYEFVSIVSKNGQNQILNQTQYEFNVIKPLQKLRDDFNHEGFEYGKYLSYTRGSYQVAHILPFTTYEKEITETNSVYKKRFSALGSLKSVSVFNSQNHLLSSQKVNYIDDLDSDGQIGVKENSYISSAVYDAMYRTDKPVINRLRIIEFPNLISSTQTLEKNYTNTVYYDKYDFLTGDVTESRSISSDGKSFKTRTVPAYLRYPGMGSKVDDINNRNMLSQTAAQYSYILDNGTWKETGVGITTWNNVWGYKDIEGNTSYPSLDKEKIWRKHKSYTWNGVVDSNGIFTNYDSATDDHFDWTVGVGQPAGSRWKQISEVTLYNHYSSPLETKDINGNYASIKTGANDTRIMVTGNAGYNEMYYCGAENFSSSTSFLEPEVSLVGGSRTKTFYHTGLYGIAATSGTEFGAYMKGGQHRAGRYRLSVWVHKTNAAKACFRMGSGSTAIPFNGESITAGNWVLKTHYFDVANASVDIHPFVNSSDGTAVYYDDLMIRPVACAISGYAYNEWDELSYIIGNNGLATRFEYDAAGRLEKTSVEVANDRRNGLIGGFKLKSKNTINYKKTP